GVLAPCGLQRVAGGQVVRVRYRRRAGGRGEVVVAPGLVADRDRQLVQVVVGTGVEDMLALFRLEGVTVQRAGYLWRAGGRGEVVVAPGVVADRDRQLVQVIVFAVEETVLAPLGLERVTDGVRARLGCAGGRGEVVVAPGVVADRDRQLVQVVVFAAEENVLALFSLESVGGRNLPRRGRARRRGQVNMTPYRCLRHRFPRCCVNFLAIPLHGNYPAWTPPAQGR